jgi:ABC-2 type transport system permease protein
MRLLGRLAWVEIKLFIREPLSMLFTFAFPFFMLLVLAGVFGNDVDPTDRENLEAWRGVGPVDYYASAYVALVMASIGLIAMPLRFASYRENGVLRRFHAAGIPVTTVIGSQAVIGVVLASIGAVGIAMASRLLYGSMVPQSVPHVIAAFAIGTVCFIAIGVALGAVLPTARAAQGAGVTLFFVMMMLGGAGPPRPVLTTGMRWAGEILPFTHVVYAMQTPWLGYGWDTWASVIALGFAAASVAVALRFFRWD